MFLSDFEILWTKERKDGSFEKTVNVLKSWRFF